MILFGMYSTRSQERPVPYWRSVRSPSQSHEAMNTSGTVRSNKPSPYFIHFTDWKNFWFYSYIRASGLKLHRLWNNLEITNDPDYPVRCEKSSLWQQLILSLKFSVFSSVYSVVQWALSLNRSRSTSIDFAGHNLSYQSHNVLYSVLRCHLCFFMPVARYVAVLKAICAASSVLSH